MARILKIDTVYAGWSTLHKAAIQTDDGAVMLREIEDHGAAVAVLPYNPETGMALLARQLRTGPLLAGAEQPRLLEAPAGLIDPGEDEETAVRREALEEVGVELTDLVRIGGVFSCPGVSTERLGLFIGRYAETGRIAAGGGLDHESESIEVVETPLVELARMAETGELTDLKTLALTLHLRLKRPDLFD